MPKRLDRLRQVIIAALALASIAGSAGAQLVNGQWRAPAREGRTGVVRERPQVVVVQPQSHPSVFPRHPVRYTLVPAVIMSDGSVLADFGFGFEPIRRSCFGGVVVGQPKVVASNGLVIPSGPLARETQPAPQIQSQSAQMLSGARTPRLSVPAQHACFNRDGHGRVFVYRVH